MLIINSDVLFNSITISVLRYLHCFHKVRIMSVDAIYLPIDFVEEEIQIHFYIDGDNL